MYQNILNQLKGHNHSFIVGSFIIYKRDLSQDLWRQYSIRPSARLLHQWIYSKLIMPRKYTRDPASRAYNAVDKNNLNNIVRRIKSRQITLAKAAKDSGIAYGTLNQKHERLAGGQPRLSAESELAIVQSIDTLTKWKVPLTGMEIKFLVKAYLDRKGINDRRFKNNLSGQDRLKSFSRRHHLVNRMADNITPVRAEVSADSINTYFDNLKTTVAGVPMANILNYDETNFTDDPGASKIVCRRGTGRVEKKIQHGKSSISVMFCWSATGQFLPPMVVYRAKHVYTEWTTGGPAGAVYESTPIGWFDSRTFTRWFQDVFLPGTEALAANGPRLIIGDNLASHFEPAVLAMCEENNVIFTLLLPNATHLLQPLDVSVFRPAKLHWRSILRQWKTDSRSRGTLPKTHLWPICTKPVTCRRKHKLTFSYVQKEEKMGFNLVQKTFSCDN